MTSTSSQFRTSAIRPVNSRRARLAIGLCATTVLAGFAAPAFAAPLDVPAGSTYTLSGSESHENITGAGEIRLAANILTVGSDDTSTTFSGSITDIVDPETTFVGSWQVSAGPYWIGASTLYSGTTAAALLFGGDASDYRISTVSDQVSEINDLAWYDGYGAPWEQRPASSLTDNGPAGYTPGDYSAYISDHYDLSKVNYAFAVSEGGSAGGGLTKVGTGTLTLSGTNSWSGLTAVSDGMLQGTTNSISGTSIVVDGTLAYNQDFSGTVAQDISGIGRILVTGLGNSNVLTFAGDLTNQGITVTDDSHIALSGASTTTGTGVLLTGANAIVDITAGASLTSPLEAISSAGGDATVNNAGSLVGGITNAGGGTLTVDNAAGASIVRTFFGSAIGSTGGELSISNGGDIIGSAWGILGSNSADTIINSGRIASGTLDGSTLSIGGISAIELRAGGSVSNLAGGLIAGGRSGIYSGGTLLLDNELGAAISGNSYGVVSGANSVIDNAGSISGGRDGVNISGSGAMVTNSGSISGGPAPFSRGVILTGTNSTVINLAGGVISGDFAIQMMGSGATVSNSGTIRTSDINPNGYAVMLFGGGTVDNLASGVIEGEFRGIYIQGGLGTVTNSGSITAAIDNGITLYSGGAATNTASGTIVADGVGGWGIFGTGGALDIVNAGSIHADSGIVIRESAASATNSGSIVAAQNGVWAYGGGIVTLDNSGSISAATGAGVLSLAGATVTNSGSITGGTYGVGVGAASTITNLSGGTIAGSSGAMLLDGAGAITVNLDSGSSTSGTIVSTGTGDRSITAAGLLDGDYDASTGTGIDSFVLAGTGSIGGAALGAGNDSFTDLGGSFSGLIDGGAGADSLLFAGTIDRSIDIGSFYGFESRTKAGASAVTLTGTDASASDWSILAGSLIASGGSAINDGATVTVAAGATLGLTANESIGAVAGAGSVTLGANTLALLADETTSFDGVISGSGGLTKIGTGTLTLGGSNSYTGVTSIAGGTIALGAADRLSDSTIVDIGESGAFDLAGHDEIIGGLTGAGSVALGGGRLTLDQSLDTLFSGAIAGTGGLTKTGAGTLYLTGHSTYTGTTFVTGGTLSVNGTLASLADVSAGGQIGGNGTIGGLSVGSGGILAPGNSIGILTVAGDISFGAGSTYEVEITPTASDLTTASGDITIDGGTVSVLASGTAYNPLTRYVILDAAGMISGQFGSVTSNLAFLSPALEYSGQQVILAVRRNDIIFSDVAENPNQTAVAEALQTLPIGTLYDAVLVQSADGARQAYQSLSGEIYASTPIALAQQAGRFRSAMLAASDLHGQGLTVWGRADRSWGQFDTRRRGGSHGLLTDATDYSAGVTYGANSFEIELAGGIATLDDQARALDSRARTETRSIGGQIGYHAGRLHARAGGAWSWHDIDTDRSIRFPGFADSTSSSQDGTTRQLYGDIGYALVDTADTRLEPFAGYTHQRTRVDGASEAGGGASLDVEHVSRSLGIATLGLRFNAVAPSGHAILKPRATLAWQHAMGDRGGSVTARFDGGDAFTVEGARIGGDSLLIEGGLDCDIGPVTIGAGLRAQVSSEHESHGASLRVGLRF